MLRDNAACKSSTNYVYDFGGKNLIDRLAQALANRLVWPPPTKEELKLLEEAEKRIEDVIAVIASLKGKSNEEIFAEAEQRWGPYPKWVELLKTVRMQDEIK